MIFARVSLESFESVKTEEPQDNADFRRGYEEGFQLASQNSEAESAAALNAVAGTLSDMSFGYEEARTHLLEELKPIMVQVAETVLPEVLKQCFADHLVEIIISTFSDASKEAIEIAVSPDSVDCLSAILSDRSGATFRFKPDNRLSSGEARLCRNETHVMIDTSAILKALQDAIRGLETIERSSSYA